MALTKACTHDWITWLTGSVFAERLLQQRGRKEAQGTVMEFPGSDEWGIMQELVSRAADTSMMGARDDVVQQVRESGTDTSFTVVDDPWGCTLGRGTRVNCT